MRQQARKRERAALHHARLTRRGYACFIAATLGIFGLLFLALSLNISSTQKGYLLKEVQRQIEEEQRAQESLRVEVARLESSSRIERVAQDELGMVRPVGSLVVRLRASGGAGGGTASGRQPGGGLEASASPQAGSTTQ
jgi:cell division protein FtsL